MGIKSSKQVDRRSSETESYSIFSLPEHVIIKILCMLDNWSLTRAVCTCPTLRRIAYNSVKLWRHSVVNLARLHSMSERTALSIKYRGIPAIELSEWRLGTRKSVSRKRFLKRMLKVMTHYRFRRQTRIHLCYPIESGRLYVVNTSIHSIRRCW